MTETTDERDQLIADLLEEAHGLRMKLEDFSQFTEAKVAEFVIARKSLTDERDKLTVERDKLTVERDKAVHHGSLAANDLEVLRRRQDDLHRQLIETTNKLREVEARVKRLVRQRDRARERVRALESSRSYRLAMRLRRLTRRVK